MSADFHTALADMATGWQALVPPSNVRPSTAVAEALMLKRPGSAAKRWDPDETPYMCEPLDMVASRRHSAIVFCGPAQSGKTVAFGEGWFSYCLLHAPGDMLVMQMTEDKAREYSKKNLARALLHSPRLKAMKSPESREDAIHDKSFKNGMTVRIGWPTRSNLASTSYPYCYGTDYDRWDDDIQGEGDGFSQMVARNRIFLSRGMTVVESSPGRPITDHTWVPPLDRPHEAPPVLGVLGIYNRSDRRRWYWQCRDGCREWFEAAPGMSLFGLDSDDDLLDSIESIDIDRYAAQHARIVCPHCGVIIPFERRYRMNLAGRWVPEGVMLDTEGRPQGRARTSSIAGYWLGGVAATYIPWEVLVRKHLQGLLQLRMAGDETVLQTTTNLDQARPYLSQALKRAAQGSSKASKPKEYLERYKVPLQARFLVACVDVQGGRNARFVVQIMAIGAYKEKWLVDRYSITKSKRAGASDDFAPIDPAAYPEDWDLLTEKVIAATYRIDDEFEIAVRETLVDTGGEDGVTANAYAWYRRLRNAGRHRRVRLTKGVDNAGDWIERETMVGGEKGVEDVPLYLLNANLLKDQVAAGLARDTFGPGYYHFPEPQSARNQNGWMPVAVLDELQAEVRMPNGKWKQVKPRNETLDLCAMTEAACNMLGADRRRFWESPPTWALPVLEGNSDVTTREARRAQHAVETQPAPAVGILRRVSRSSYLD